MVTIENNYLVYAHSLIKSKLEQYESKSLYLFLELAYALKTNKIKKYYQLNIIKLPDKY